MRRDWKNAWLIAATIIAVTGVLCTGIFCVVLIRDSVVTEMHSGDGEVIKQSDTEAGMKRLLDAEEDRKQLESKEDLMSQLGEGQEDESQRMDHDDRVQQSDVPSYDREQLLILQDPSLYRYQDMEQDLEKIPYLYDTDVRVGSLGKTVDDRELYHVTIGDPSAEHKIFINGSIHGREYMTSQLVMKQMVGFLDHVSQDDEYNGWSYKELLKDTVIHVVPMVNPDGVTISQLGLSGVANETVKSKIIEIAALDGAAAEGYYLTRWKSNANGVDLNRNFDALWDSYAGTGHPSSDHYKGASVGCEVESAALIQLTQKEMFDRTISYHTQGSVIYWYFGQSGNLYDTSLDFAACISEVTGYPTDANYEYLDPAGYKDWGLCDLGIPGLTVEIGYETSPVPPSQFSSIWQKNQYVWEATILHAKGYES